MNEMNPGILFEESIFDFIKGKLSKDETIEYEKAFGREEGKFYRSDIYLPEGCKVLEFPTRSIIELKLVLRPDTLYMLYHMFVENKAKWGVDSFIVIYNNRKQLSIELLSVYKRYIKDHFFVYSLQEILNGETLKDLSKPRFEK